MCGIVAMVGRPEAGIVRGMTRLLEHRGPDGEGVVCPPGEPFGLGHRRLSIIDLSSAGSQPMSDPSGRFWITYNGEVYNFRELRAQLEGRGRRFSSQTDTEVVLAAYETWGPECLDRLNGMFAFAIWDRHTRRLFAARDRLGIKPLYWASSGVTLLLASEAKAILASGEIPVEVDEDVLRNPWHFPLSPRTGFKHVRKLPAGHLLTWQDGTVVVRRWWSIEPHEGDLSQKAAAEALAELLQEAVRMQMVADVPVGALLSGGLDSSTIVALMRSHTPEPVRTFTIRFRDVDRRLEAMPEDSRFARSVASRFGCRHREITITPDVVRLLPKLVWHLDEPMFDPASLNTYLIAKAARDEGVPVLLNGMGADEIFGGYRKHYACLLADRYQAMVPGRLRAWIERALGGLPVAGRRSGFRNVRWAKRFLSFASLPQVDRFLLADLSLSPREYADLYVDAEAHPYDQLADVRAHREAFDRSGSSYLTRMCLADTLTFLPDHNLTYTDKACMAVGVEARPPLIDHRIVEFAFTLPDAHRIRGTRQKILFRQAASRWLPREIVSRPKAAFGVPLRAWVRHDLKEMVDDLLSAESLRARGLYRPEVVRSRIDADRAGSQDHAHFVWNLLSKELWLRAFVDGGGNVLREARATVRDATRPSSSFVRSDQRIESPRPASSL